MEGKEITYNQVYGSGIDVFSVTSSRRDFMLTLIFGLSPMKTVEKVFELTNLMKDEAPRLPPPAWAFGYHMPLIEDRTEFLETVGTIRSKEFSLPLEGFIQYQNDLNNELGLSVRAEDDVLIMKYIKDNKYTFTALQNPGYPLLGRYQGDKNPAMILDKKLAVMMADGKTPYEDVQKAGRVFYLNNKEPEVANIYKDMYDKFISQHGLNASKVAVESVRNEITRALCQDSSELCPNVMSADMPSIPGPNIFHKGLLP
jgi:hypothetical protein